MLRRKLTFHRWQDIEGRSPFVPHEAAEAIVQLTTADPHQAVFVDGDSTTVVLVYDTGTSNTPTKLQLLALRDPDNRPLQFGPGEPLGPIDMLAHRYPADVTHVEIWPDHLAGQDFHGNAPRLSRLSRYLRHTVSHFVSFEHLFQPDVADRLDDVRGQLRGVDIALTRPERVDHDRGLFSTLIPAVYGHNAPSVSVHVGMGRFGPRDRYLDAQTEAHIFEIAEHAQDLVDQLIVTGRSRRTGQSARVDLVNERLFAERQLPRSPQGGSMPETGATFNELEELHTQWSNDGTFATAVQAQAMRPR